MSREYKQKKEDTPSSKAYSMSSHYKILLLIRFIQNIIQNIIQHPQPSCGGKIVVFVTEKHRTRNGYI